MLVSKPKPQRKQISQSTIHTDQSRNPYTPAGHERAVSYWFVGCPIFESRSQRSGDAFPFVVWRAGSQTWIPSSPDARDPARTPVAPRRRPLPPDPRRGAAAADPGCVRARRSPHRRRQVPHRSMRNRCATRLCFDFCLPCHPAKAHCARHVPVIPFPILSVHWGGRRCWGRRLRITEDVLSFAMI